MSDLIEDLRNLVEFGPDDFELLHEAADQLEQQQETITSLLAVLNEIKEIYAGMEGIKTETAVEAYLIRIIEKMYAEATKTLAEHGDKE